MNPLAVKLTDDEVKALEAIAERTGSLAQTSTRAGQPSWRVLVKRLARGELRIIDEAAFDKMVEEASGEAHRLRQDALYGDRGYDEEKLSTATHAFGKVEGLKEAWDATIEPPIIVSGWYDSGS